MADKTSVLQKFSKEHPVLAIIALLAIDGWAASIVKAIEGKRKKDDIIDVEFKETN